MTRTTRTASTAALAALLLLAGACSSPGPQSSAPSGDESPTATSQAERPVARARLSIGSAPTAQAADRRDLLVPATVTVRPAEPGAQVTMEASTDQGRSWSEVPGAQGEQDAEGRAFLQLPTVEPGSRVAYRAVAAVDGGDDAVSRRVVPSAQEEVFADDFEDRELYEQQWAQRYTNLYHGSRLCSTPDPRRLAMADGVLTLSVKQVRPPGTRSPGDAGYSCKDGVWDNAMIGTALAPRPFTFTYGTAAARMRVQPGRGSHGAFWLQQTAEDGAEIDVIEYYGDGSKDGLQSKIHYGTGEDLESSGGTVPTRGAVAEGASPADGWHVYSVEWGPRGYVFAIDGRVTWRTAEPGVASGPEELALSLLTSDWNLPNMNDPDTTLEVDWVRAWQDPKAATSQQ